MSVRLHKKGAPAYGKNDRLLLLQVNIICLLLALIGTTVVIQHPEWFGP